MDNKTYISQPIELGNVMVPKELQLLAEKIAKNTHDVWAVGRISQGWSWGPVRDDALKQHPCLVPYEGLSEDEKEYDRRTSMETIKLILSLGYEVKPKSM